MLKYGTELSRLLDQLHVHSAFTHPDDLDVPTFIHIFGAYGEYQIRKYRPKPPVCKCCGKEHQ